MRPQPVRHDGPVDVNHLLKDHGMDRKVVRVRQTSTPAAERFLTLWLEMQHGVDHAQRSVGHEHN